MTKKTVNPKSLANLKPFPKGYDPRRNLDGVPVATIEARKLFQKIAAELLEIKERRANGEEVQYEITRIEALIRLKMSSKAPEDFKTILKALWPELLKDNVDVDLNVDPEKIKAYIGFSPDEWDSDPKKATEQTAAQPKTKSKATKKKAHGKK